MAEIPRLDNPGQPTELELVPMTEAELASFSLVIQRPFAHSLRDLVR
jgi:hypothetical protein